MSGSTSTQECLTSKSKATAKMLASADVTGEEAKPNRKENPSLMRKSKTGQTNFWWWDLSEPGSGGYLGGGGGM